MKWHGQSYHDRMKSRMEKCQAGQSDSDHWRHTDYHAMEPNFPFNRPWHGSPNSWHNVRPLKRRFLFGRFIFFFFPVLFVFTAIILSLMKVLAGSIQQALPDHSDWMPLIFAFPVFLGFVFLLVGGLAFRRLGSPLADVMAALDAVADGNLSVRVDESTRGEFGRMARSFNRMAEELENAEQNRRNLTADVAHELRTPLHIIQGNLEGMLDGVYEPSKEQITATLDETRLLARLVSDLQTLSLAEAGKLHLHPQPILIPDLMEDTVTGFSLIAGENGISLENVVSGTDEQLTVNADPDRLSQIMNNLVANAIRYTPRGGSIRLKVEPSADGVTLTVKDTGSGISPEDLPYVFDRFWKAEKSRSRHEGTGSGLGLAIARQLVQAHGGTIRVESQPGQGTCFIITLPSDRS
jgi:two-component system, OmpR family, sensor histidine kinase BaeS